MGLHCFGEVKLFSHMTNPLLGILHYIFLFIAQIVTITKYYLIFYNES